MLRPHIFSAALFVGCLVLTADVYGQETSAERTGQRLENQSQRLDNQAQRLENKAQRQENTGGEKDRSGVKTESRNYRGNLSESKDMEFKYEKVTQLKSKLLDSNLIRQANQEYENQKDELAQKIASEIIVQVLSEDRLFVASLKEKLMDEHKDQKVSKQDKEDMHQRIAEQKEMIMNDQEKLKDLLAQVVMRCKVEEKLEHMMNGDDHDHQKDTRQAHTEKDGENRN